MAKEVVEKSHQHHDNSAGVVGVVFGVLSLVFAVVPIIGFVLGVIGVIFSHRQNRSVPNKWSKAGLWLCWIGSIIGAIWSIYYIKMVIELATQYQAQLQAFQANSAGSAGLNTYGSK